MLRWQSSVSEVDFRNAQRLHSDSFNVPVNPELFTETAIATPLLGWQQKPATLWASLYCILLAAYAILVIASLLVDLPITPTALFSICNLLLLLLTGLLQHHMNAQLKKSQRQGYLKFSAILEWVVNQPFQTVAYGTSAVLLVVTWNTLQQKIGIPHLLLLRAIILLQLAWTSALVGIFICKVRGHNKSQCNPDAMFSLASPLRPPFALDDIR